MKHKHYDVIVAKAANMHLVMFIKLDNHGGEWVESTVSPSIPWCEESEYFLCLPQQKEACLHWLNGGDAQTRNEYSDLSWDTLLPFEGSWSKASHFMCSDILLRIKPKKEKRWIGYCANRNQTFPHPQGSKELAWDYAARNYSYHTSEWQVIEIEVEV